MKIIEDEKNSQNIHAPSLLTEKQEEEKESLPSLDVVEVSSIDIDVEIARRFFNNPKLSMIEYKSLASDLGVEEHLLDDITAIQRSLWKKRLKTGGAVVLGAISGMMMTPVFLEHLESIASRAGFDLSDDDASANALLYSTMGMLMTESILCNVAIFQDDREVQNGKYHWIGKSFLAAQSFLPVMMLWNIEFAHQKSAQSSGFDEYMTTFTLGVLPLFASSYLYGQQTALTISYDQSPLTQREKYIAYGLPALNSIARGFMGYVLCSTALEALSDHEEVNVAVSVLAGCLVSNGKGFFQEVNGFKRLIYNHRDANSFSWKNTAKKTGLIILNTYKTIPYASSILYGMQDKYLMVRSVLATQMFLTHLTASVGTSLGFLTCLQAR